VSNPRSLVRLVSRARAQPVEAGQIPRAEHKDSEAGVMPEEKLIAKIAKYHEERESGTKT